MTAHHVDQRQCAADVVLVVFPGLLHTLADGFEASEMDASVKFMLGKDALESLAVTDVDLVERYFGYADDFCHALKGDGIGVAEVVDHHGGVASLIKFYQSVGAYESGSAGDEDVH